MYTLGIETSCDETSVSVVNNGTDILSNVVASSLEFHQQYGGVVPEIAFRTQLETIVAVTDDAIKKAGIARGDLALVSVTNGPGLLGSLLVGISFAKALSLSLRIPLIGVNHLYSHIYAGYLKEKQVRLPFVGLVVSGGHTSLFLVKDFATIKTLGQTQDDACGEAFDKVAKILGLGYPGGPLIEAIARQGDPQALTLQCSGTQQPLNFSFSGIKTAVLYYVQKKFPRGIANTRAGRQMQADIAASFQESVIDTLLEKSFHACKLTKINRLVVGGGVVANMRLREAFEKRAAQQHVEVYFPTKALCMDNAAMVAGFGYQLFKRGARSNLSLNAGM
ncbi:MAG: tRNA (adenosine(37)-N6)-threonylcarbamoyltransferase complex transferase subunit TsaD [Candidatus Omnitrophica bacterium]|nr:tRNA (adenosine(37)-N6)-threonylcarbamoyltransferase complex transferase subunit TsaD [Candidatus Omnitrophota bacterium]